MTEKPTYDDLLAALTFAEAIYNKDNEGINAIVKTSDGYVFLMMGHLLKQATEMLAELTDQGVGDLFDQWRSQILGSYLGGGS